MRKEVPLLMNKAGKPLRTYIIAIILTMALIFGILMGTISLLVSRHYSRKQSEQSHGVTTNMLRIQYIDFFKRKEQELNTIGQRLASTEYLANILNRSYDTFPHYKHLFLLDIKGNTLDCCVGINLPTSFLEKISGNEKHMMISDVFEHKGELLIGLSYAVPTRDYHIVATMSLDYMNKNLEVSRVYSGESGYPFLLDSKGNLVVHSNKDNLGNNILDLVKDNQDNSLDFDAFTGASYKLINYLSFDEPRLVGLGEVEPYGWIAGFSQKEREVYAPFFALLHTLLPVFFVLMLLSVAIAIYISNKFLGPIEHISQRVRDMLNKNELTPIYLEYAPEEIVLLKDGINKLVQDVADNSLNAVESLILTIEARDHATRGHSQRVALLAEKVAQKLDISPEEKEILRTAAILHDIGKLAVPDKILQKPASLTFEEYNIIKKHPKWGREILIPMNYLKREIEIVFQHHERPDGLGYPQGLTKEEIDPLAGTISAVDALEAMTADRPYRKGRSIEAALADLKEGRGKQFDPQIVDVLLALGEEGELNFLRDLKNLA